MSDRNNITSRAHDPNLPFTSTSPMPAKNLGELISQAKVVRSKWNPDGSSPEEIWFRGLSSNQHKLLPSIYRPDITSKNLHNLEGTLIKRFKSQSLPYIDTAIIDDITTPNWNWYVTARHHGLPTRLMDWSESLLVAAYFAVETHQNKIGSKLLKEHRTTVSKVPLCDNTPCIWMIDAGTLNKVSNEDDDVVFSASNPVLADYMTDPEHGKGLLPKAANTLPIAVAPDMINRRITAQRGVFTLHGSEHVPLERIEAGFRIHRLDISRHAIGIIIDELDIAGIHVAAIYPDMDSAAKRIVWQYSEE
jgi:FRG domain